MVVDAATLPWRNDAATLGRMRTRDEVVGTPLATSVYAVFDAVLEQDERLRRFFDGRDWKA